MTGPQLLMSMADIARLARVRRPVVTMWRSRFRDAARPFPGPVVRSGGQDLFNPEDVGAWLVGSGHGNNPEADRDAAAFVSVATLDAGEATAALALRALAGEPLAGRDLEDLLDLADAVDPDDAFLYRELSQAAGRLPRLADMADRMTEAAYTPAAAFERLVSRRRSTGLDHGTGTALSPTLLELAAETCLTMAATTGAERFAEATPGGSDLIVAVAAALGEPGTAALDVGAVPAGEPVADPDAGSGRLALRRLQVLASTSDGLGIGAAGAAGPRILMAQFPGPGDPDAGAAACLAQIDELALSLGEDDASLVVAPAAVLMDAVTGPAEQQRSRILRLGRIRAAVRLPAGLAPARVRQPMAVWVLGADQQDVPIAERWTMVADLTSEVLDAAARQDLVSDLAASLGSTLDVKAHAFRFARLVSTSSLLARQGTLTAPLRPPGPATRLRGVRPADVLVRAERAVEGLADFPARANSLGTSHTDLTVRPGPQPPAEWSTVGDLLAAGALAYLPGTALQDEAVGTGATGLRVLEADHLTGSGAASAAHIAHVVLAAGHPRTRLTEPGDVVFRSGPTPAAVVDRVGSAVVRSPARTLRAAPGSGVVPTVLAEDLAAAPGGPWRHWPVRVFSPEVAARLTAALGLLDDDRAELVRRLDRLDELRMLVTEGTALGSLETDTTVEGTAS